MFLEMFELYNFWEKNILTFSLHGLKRDQLDCCTIFFYEVVTVQIIDNFSSLVFQSLLQFFTVWLYWNWKNWNKEELK